MLPPQFSSLQHHTVADATDTLPITVTEQDLKGGVDGVVQTLREAERLVKRDVSDKLIQRIVRTLKGDDEYDTLRNIYRYVVDNFEYITDDNIRRLLMRLKQDKGEKQFEVLTAPRHLIRHCNYQGCPTNDCDEFSLLLGNMALVSNLVNGTHFQPAFKVIAWRLDAFIPGTSTISYTHVYSTVYVPSKQRWVPMDATYGRVGFDFEKDPAIVQRHLIYHIDPVAGQRKIETFVNKAFKGKPQKAKPKGVDSLQDNATRRTSQPHRTTTSHSPTFFSHPMSKQYFGMSDTKTTQPSTFGQVFDQATSTLEKGAQDSKEKVSTALSTISKPSTSTTGTSTGKATGTQQKTSSGMSKVSNPDKSDASSSTGFDISKPENMAIVGGGVAVAIIAGVMIARHGKGKKSGKASSGKAKSGSKKSGKKGRTLSDPASPSASAPVARPVAAPASTTTGMSDGKRRSKKRKPKSAAPKRAAPKKATAKKAGAKKAAPKRKKSTAKR